MARRDSRKRRRVSACERQWRASATATGRSRRRAGVAASRRACASSSVAGGDRVSPSGTRCSRPCREPRRGNRRRRPSGRRCGPRTRAGRSRRADAARPVSTTALGLERAERACRAGSASIAGVSDSVRTPGAPQHQLERLRVQGVEVEPGPRRRRSGSPSARVAGGDRRLSADSQPVAWRHPNSYSAVWALVVGVRRSRPRAVPPRSSARPSAASRLSSSSRFARPRRTRRTRAARRDGRRRTLAALARERDRERDVVGLGERQPQRLDLGECVLAVTAGRAVRRGKP